jgi:hypothetical protein
MNAVSARGIASIYILLVVLSYYLLATCICSVAKCSVALSFC